MSTEMSRSKSQAVYSFLPHMWVASRGDAQSVTAEIIGWNYLKMDNIYQNFIEGEIKRQIRLFGNRGGDISSFNINDGEHSFTIVEPAMNDTVQDITGRKSPLVFYCNSCHRAFEERNPQDIDLAHWECPNCHKSGVKQLQMIYSCECGHAEPVKIPYVRNGSKDIQYRPNDGRRGAYHMYVKNNGKEDTLELAIKCPSCGQRLTLDNAESSRNYKPFSLKIINIADTKNGEFFEKGIDAQKTLVSKWLGKLSQEKFLEILDNIPLAFSASNTNDAKRKEAEKAIDQMITAGMMPEAMREAAISKMLGVTTENALSVEPYTSYCDKIFAKRKKEDEESYKHWIENFSFKLMQYNTLKYAPKVLTLEDSISKQLSMDFIDSREDITDLNERMGISSMQVSCDIEVINCSYGFTRKTSDPHLAKKRLKLVAFDHYKDNVSNLVYGTKLETEGILFEIDRVKILDWFLKNEIITEEQMPDTEDEVAVKEWFSENVHSELVNIFSGVDDGEKITKNVLALLHSISHAFIKTAGEISGLEDTSLTEVILLETTSIFIYAQTSQGTPLGALSGMIETNYYNFLQKALEETKNCIFDPICLERDDTACSACLKLPEICCEFFNHDLGRKYLYTLKDNKDTKKPFIGFWEM